MRFLNCKPRTGRCRDPGHRVGYNRGKEGKEKITVVLELTGVRLSVAFREPQCSGLCHFANSADGHSPLMVDVLSETK